MIVGLIEGTQRIHLLCPFSVANLDIWCVSYTCTDPSCEAAQIMFKLAGLPGVLSSALQIYAANVHSCGVTCI